MSLTLGALRFCGRHPPPARPARRENRLRRLGAPRTGTKIVRGSSMKPVVFDPCFAWLPAAEGRSGVVLCNPFGYDPLCTHRSWRKLAERIAAARTPVLRSDYPAAGDTTGFEVAPQPRQAS